MLEGKLLQLEDEMHSGGIGAIAVWVCGASLDSKFKGDDYQPVNDILMKNWGLVFAVSFLHRVL